MKKLPLVSIITVNYNGKRFLKDCFDSLYNLNYPKDSFEIFMVDNGSKDNSIAFVREKYPKIKIIQNDVNNYARANNLGIKASKGKYIALINNDTKVDPNWLIELIKVIDADESIGAVGSKILFMDGRISSTGHQELPNYYWIDRGFKEEDHGQFDEIEEVPSICGCSVVFRKECFKEVGLLDEDFSFFVEDVDMGIRLKKSGRKLMYIPKSKIYHVFHGSFDAEKARFNVERNRLLLLAKHFPEKLTESLLGNAYFTAQEDIQMHAKLYTLLPDLVLKLIKHHKIEIVKDVISGAFKELKKISEYENSILIAKVKDFLHSVELHQKAIKDKDQHINNLNAEVEKREVAIKDKDQHINNLNAEVEKRKVALDDIYNSTAFKFLVRPLWSVLWKIKQIIKCVPEKTCVLSSSTELESAHGDPRFDPVGIGICTIISKNYLAYARVLAESFLKYNKGNVFVLLTDKIDAYFDPAKEKFTLIEVDTIKDRIENFEKFCFQYNATEINTAVKPFFLEFLFEKYQLQKLIFFDPDILITYNLNYLFKLLDNFSIVLIPHITQPFPDNRKPAEVEILRSGVYNLGFIALANTKTTKCLLSWWQKRLSFYCKIDVQQGLFVDQKWIDLIPGFFDDVFILRDVTYNVAYWNFHYRNVEVNNSSILVNGAFAHFLHFSGFNPFDINAVSKHQDRFTLKDLHSVEPVFKFYRNELLSHGYNESRNWPCVFDYFDNGVKIADIMRKIYWTAQGQDSVTFGNPFNVSGRKSYFNWLNESLDSETPVITRLMQTIYKERPDLQHIYPDIYHSDRQAFVTWFLMSAKQEYGIEEVFRVNMMPHNRRKMKMPLVSIHSRIIYKTKGILKGIFKKMFRNDLRIISNLKILEMRLYRKITNITSFFSKKFRLIAKLSQEDGMNVFGHLTGEFGVGEGVRANVHCLKTIGVDFALINITSHSCSRKNDSSFPVFSSKNPYFINLFHVNADMLPKLYIEQGVDRFKDKYNIGFWTWELSDFPEEWFESFCYCDEIWVPSNFVLSSIAKKSPIPVIKIPHAVVVDKIKGVDRSYFGFNKDDFIFLFMFDFLSYFERKNPLAIVESFKKSFPLSKNVRLVLKCINSSYDTYGMTQLKNAVKGFNIDIIDNYINRDEVNALLSLCDCYVSLHRCEGFGLTLAEAMYLGKLVIATGFSGNTDFMNVNNSFLVRYKLVEIEKDIGPYRKGNIWAQPDIEHAVELMKHVYNNRVSVREIGENASTDIRRNLSYKVIGNEIKQRINYIQKIVVEKDSFEKKYY